MPRDLSEVLHYFLPDVDGAAPPADPPGVAAAVRPVDPPGVAAAVRPVDPPGAVAAPHGGPTLPIVAVPVGNDEPVREALLWNLGIEIARHGGRSRLLRPDRGRGTGHAHTERQPLGCELIECAARDLDELHRAAVAAALCGARGEQGGAVLVQVPTDWLEAAGPGASLLAWTLLLTRCEPAELRAAWRLAETITAARPDAHLGVTLHGAPSLDHAEQGFAALARAARSRLGRDLSSYGVLVDDLAVYRARAARRPIGLAHPQSLAARALHDVAGLLLEDARDRSPA